MIGWINEQARESERPSERAIDCIAHEVQKLCGGTENLNKCFQITLTKAPEHQSGVGDGDSGHTAAIAPYTNTCANAMVS